MTMRFSADPRVIMSSPIHCLAFGFGSGLSPKAPGTVGTLVALPLVWALMHVSLPVYLCTVVMLSLLGLYVCDVSAKRLGVEDHPGIVFDEFIGMAITMIGMSLEFRWLVLGFVAFRCLDIGKPWPIREADRRLSGGLGIMLDDMIAGAIACGLLHIADDWF